MNNINVDLTKISIIFGFFVVALSKNNTLNLSILTLLTGNSMRYYVCLIQNS